MPSLVCRTPRQMSRTATCKYGGYTLHEPSDQIRARQLTASLDDGVVAYAPLVRHLFARRENILKVCQHRRHSRASARSTTRARTPCASVKSWVDRLDADIRAVHAHAQGVPRYRRPPFRLATVTFDPELHDLSSAADTRTARRARASVYIDEVVDWYRARLRDYEYCAFSDPTLRGVARRYVRVERMAKRGRVAVVFPVPADADEDDVRVERACIVNPDDGGNHPMTLFVRRDNGVHTQVLVGTRLPASSARKSATGKNRSSERGVRSRRK